MDYKLNFVYTTFCSKMAIKWTLEPQYEHNTEVFNPKQHFMRVFLQHVTEINVK